MASKRKRQLEECVLRILEHADMNRITESKIRKLAGEETGFDLKDKVNKDLVKQVVQDFFVKVQQDALQEKEVDKKVHKPAAKQQPPSNPKRRRMIPVDDDEEEEEEEEEHEAKPAPKRPIAQAPARNGRRRLEITVSDDEDDEELVAKVKVAAAAKQNFGKKATTRKAIKTDEEDEDSDESQDVVKRKRSSKPSIAKKGAVQNSGKKEIRREAIETDEEEDEDEKSEDSGESQDEFKRKRSSKPSRTRRANAAVDTDEEEVVQPRVEPQKGTVQRPAKRRAAISDDDESDVDDDEDGEGEGKRAGPSKRTFTSSLRNERRRIVRDDEEEEVLEERHPKRWQTNDNGDLVICQLSKTRSVTVQHFKGKTMVSIREYYEKEGKMLPSLKGISLPVEQWETLKEVIPDIEAAIRHLKR